jgi:3'-phosphoadenosine 5'-phosphosulfate sulfotransferase (PAPS reductase)/FAD synthetase
MGDAIENVRKLVAEHGDNLAIVANHSGGKDSQRMLGFLRAEFPNVKTYVVMADTGFEHVKPVPAIEWGQRQAASFGLELHVVRNPNKTYLEMVERRGKFPSSATRQCTSDLKRGPIEKFIRHLPEKIILNCTGIRAAESPKRAKQNPWKVNEGLSVAGRQVWNWMPIFEESLQDVLNWHWSNNQPLHPVYITAYHVDGTTGGYLRRFSCRVCIFSTNADIRAIYDNDRPAFDAVADLEVKMNFTMRSGKSLFQIIDQTDPADGKQYGSEEIVDAPCI